jgi:MerR family transcriptional regulator, thiopeptide resistance regulator
MAISANQHEENIMRSALWKVGELAKHAGVSVRTLHYYDAIGLLSPSQHSDAGYRLYAACDIARLQQILSLRELGLSLVEIRDLLGRSDVSPQRVIELQISRLKEQIKLQRALCTRLEAIATRLSAAEEVSVEEFFQTMELMSMMDKIETYYTTEQLEALKRRREDLGEARIRQAETVWPELIAQVRAEMEHGTDPRSERVKALARQWRTLVEEFTGGDRGIDQSLQTMYENEPAARERSGIDPQMFAYIGQALTALKTD